MSVVTYNNVTLPFTHTTNFSQEDIYDESDTNYLYTRFNIVVGAVVNTAYSEITGLGGEDALAGGGNPATLMELMRKKLMTPRKALSFEAGGANLIPNPGKAKSTIDAKNGPHPQFFNMTMLTNETFLVSYGIVTHITIPENTTTTNSSGAISNRWTESVELDGRNYTSRTRSGKITVRSNCGKQVDSFRESLAVLNVPNGFLRTKSSYNISSDGLSLSYSVTDREVFRMPPEGAFEAEGQYIESVSNMGAMRWGAISIRLRGSKTSVYTNLVQTAVSICSSKLLLVNAFVTDMDVDIGGGEKRRHQVFGRLETFTIKIGMYDNDVEVSMRAMLNNNSFGTKELAGVNFTNLCTVPGSTSFTKQPNYLPRGTAGYMLQAAAYWDPALKGVELDKKGGQLTKGIVPGVG